MRRQAGLSCAGRRVARAMGGDTYFVEGLIVSARRRVRRLISSALRLFISRG